MCDFHAEVWHSGRMTFDKNDRSAIEAALQDTDAGNPIADAVAEAIQGFIENLEQQAHRNKKWPTELLLYRPETAFDDIVIHLTLQAVADELGHVIDIHWIENSL